MRKTETGAAGIKAAYVCPRIACFAAASESSLCAVSPIDSGHKNADPDPNPLEPVDDGQW
ncbi:hypothetical protein FIN92_07605 [Prevotella brunnea]|uniref:hypothetical protein n=1 Tax=Prevotella brunnea TaxID=2508867 RepID=UPI00282273DB|nr:hypothetical protein [Prevotella brunnea]MDR0186437.1 hypothetical protein [Prevotella brunnea]